MLGLLRTAISVLFISLLVWCSFTVPLGRRTFADHVDRIGQTREARELIHGTRARINPVLDEAKNRLLGEYVEAPTFVPAGEGEPPRARPRRNPDATPASTLRGDRGEPAARESAPPEPAALREPSTAAGARLPGRRRPATTSTGE